MTEGDPKEEEIEPPPDTDREGEEVEEVDETDLAASVPAPALFTPKFCMVCGEERRPEAKFCHGCGGVFDVAE